MRTLEFDHDLAGCILRVNLEVQTIPVVLSTQRPLAATRCLIDERAPYIRVVRNAHLRPIWRGVAVATSGFYIAGRSCDLGIAGGCESRRILIVLVPPIALRLNRSQIGRA